MTDDESKKIQIQLDHEQKVIHLGCWFHDLKGVLIAEATEEDKKNYYCGKYMTYPIVDDDWFVREDDCIRDGIALLTIGRKGDTIPLIKLSEVLDLNADVRDCEYSDILTDVERHEITVSNRKMDNPQEELPETITLEIDKIRPKKHIYRIDSDYDGYYIPRRFCHVGKDGQLYHDIEEKEDEVKYQYSQIVRQIADDVNSLMWFFNKHNLKVRCISVRSYDESKDNEDRSIPDSWHQSVKTLEEDINSEVEQLRGEYPDDHYKHKRPIL